MPYNTRKKSFSLSELGIAVPKRSRTASHPSPPSTIAEGEEPPAKKSKRSHASGDSPATGLMSPPRQTTIRIKEEKPKRMTELSPPPSPVVEGSNKIDIEGISDEIVVGAIQQLEKTGNRPHLVKELAHVLAGSLPCIEKSANPSALISSHLTAYLHRPWPTISPCPLAKELSPVHPRRLYFYLTTTPHQPIPETTTADSLSLSKPRHRIISPSLSSASAADEEEHGNNPLFHRQRTQLSPSPEVDLSSPDLDEDAHDQLLSETPGGRFSGRNSVARGAGDSRASSLSLNPHPRRAASPQLEREERDFKLTASLLHEQALLLRRRTSEGVRQGGVAGSTTATSAAEHTKAGAEINCPTAPANVTMSIENDNHNDNNDNSDNAAMAWNDDFPANNHNDDDVAALFGSSSLEEKNSFSFSRGLIGERGSLMDFSSPVLQPQRPRSFEMLDLFDDDDVDDDQAQAVTVKKEREREREREKEKRADEEMEGLSSLLEQQRQPCPRVMDRKGNYGVVGDQGVEMAKSANSEEKEKEEVEVKEEATSRGWDFSRDLQMPLEPALAWESLLQSPEKVDVAELEVLFDAY